MARARVSIDSGKFVPGGEVSSGFFGGNLLFDRDRVGEEGTFDEKAEALNISFIRYPGGTITEEMFDLTDPDRSSAPEARTGELMPLSAFLDYVARIDGAASVVLPTIRYMDALEAGTTTEGAVRAELAAFLEALAAGAYGDPSLITHLEIGNEYYYHEGFAGDLPAAYGRVARIIAEEIAQVFGDGVNIAVQAGADAADNRKILAAFAGRDDLVDSVIVHSYPWDLGQVYEHAEWKTWLADQWRDSGLAESVFLSEWNISNQRVHDDGAPMESDLVEDGMARAVALVEMAAGYIAAGYDYAAVWPLQQNTRGDLAGDEGETAATRGDKLSVDGLTPVGKAFQMMSEVLPGMRMLDIDGRIDIDRRAEAPRYESEALVNAFADDEKVVIFVSAWEIDAAAGFLDVSLEVDGAFTSYDVTTLTSLGGAYDDPNVDPVTVTEEGLAYDGGLTIRLARDYEVKRIVLKRDEGVSIDRGGAEKLYGGDGADTLLAGAGDHEIHALGGDDMVIANQGADLIFGGAGSDRMRGGDGGDRLKGQGDDDWLWGEDGFDFIAAGGGHDRVFGGRGDDVARGGAGDDAVRGGGGRDLVSGGAGDDLLRGGGGRDQVVGGGGDDTLLGGGGADRLSGGAGEDRLVGGGGVDILEGGAGRDVFVAGSSDVVADFEDGLDMLEFGGAAGFAALTLRQTEAGVEIVGGGARLTVAGVDMDELSAADFIF